jgi:hypothetical protein
LLPRNAREVRISKSSYYRIILGDSKIYPYILRLKHHLTEGDPDRHLEWYERFEEMCREEPDLVDKIIWSDEAWFTLNGYINCHYCVFWSETNPHVEVDVEMHHQNLMVWGGVWSNSRVGPFFFDQTITGAVYLDMLKN